MKYQDIHIADRSYWNRWHNNFMSTNSLENSYIYKATLAQHFNDLINALTLFMNTPVQPDFKANIIQTSVNPPSDISSDPGKNMYFQLIFHNDNNI